VAAHVTHEAESAFGDHLAGRAVARFADAHDHRLDPSAIRQLAQEKDVVEALCSSRVGPAPGLRPQVPNKETTVANVSVIPRAISPILGATIISS